MPKKEGRRGTQMRTETEADPPKTEHPPHPILLIHFQNPHWWTQSEHVALWRGRSFTEKCCKSRRYRS